MSRQLSFLLVVTLVLITNSSAVNYNEQLERDEIIEAVNSAKTTWTAGRNFDPSLKKDYIKSLLGTKKLSPGSPSPNYSKPNKSAHKVKDIPTKFDSRTEWKNCTGMTTIVDQGSCGSCWAVAAASAFSDRLCVATQGEFNRQLSAENIMSCCSYCGYGCDGGYVGYAWSFLQESGIPTGGPYGSHEGCQPYTLPPCNHSAVESELTEGMKACSSVDATPACKLKCYNKRYKTKYDHDFHEVSSFFMYAIVADAQEEILTNGPIETSFDVYEDFFSYKSGVYQHTTGDYLGGHAVKILGWGTTENGTDYWIVANSWNKSWGQKGFFKFIRGINDCNFELEMVGGIPDTSSFRK